MSTSSVPKAKNTESFSNSRTSFTGAALKPPKLQSFQRLSSSDSKVCQLYYDRFLPYNWQHDSTHTIFIISAILTKPHIPVICNPRLDWCQWFSSVQQATVARNKQQQQQQQQPKILHAVSNEEITDGEEESSTKELQPTTDESDTKIKVKCIIMFLFCQQIQVIE